MTDELVRDLAWFLIEHHLRCNDVVMDVHGITAAGLDPAVRDRLLGNPGGAEWKRVEAAVGELINELFPTYPPVDNTHGGLEELR